MVCWMRTRFFSPIAWCTLLVGTGCGLADQGLEQVPSSTDGGAQSESIDGGTGKIPGSDAGTTSAYEAGADAGAADGSGSQNSDAESMNDDSGSQGADSEPPGDDSGSPVLDATSPASDTGSPIKDAAEESAHVEAGPCGNSGNPCITVPAGWTLVAFATSRGTACPAGFTGQTTNLVEGPTTTASACSCGACSVTTPPSCASGQIPVHYDSTLTAGKGTCDLVAVPGTGPLANSPAGGCGTDLYQGSYVDFDISYTSPAATGGACAVPGTASGMGVTYASQDLACAPTSASSANCTGNTCAPNLTGPFAACIMTSGVVACPAGPLSAARTVGTSATATCSACGCSVAATCQGTVTVYSDDNCKDSPYSVPADGSCNPIYKQGQSYNSYIYTGGTPHTTCTPSGSSTVQSTTLVNEATICCAP